MRICLLLILGLGSLQGCYTLQIYSSAEEPVQFNHPQSAAPPPQVVRHFYRELQLDYVLGHLQQDQGLINRLLQEEAAGHQVHNLSIRRSFNFLDLLVSLLTLGIYSRSWLVVEGDLIRS